jgi:hypothetical protein
MIKFQKVTLRQSLLLLVGLVFGTAIGTFINYLITDEVSIIYGLMGTAIGILGVLWIKK